MKKACPYCGKIHDIKYTCQKKPQRQKKSDPKIDAFRSSTEWKRMREQVKQRDRYLCQACYNNFSGTLSKYNTEDLSVHHIRPLRTDFELRLDPENLITLCQYHHELAERGAIPVKTLLEMIPPGVSAAHREDT